jgi:putative endonuclease
MSEAPRWFCYMLECADGTFYIGAAIDPDARVRKHNWGVGSRLTRRRRPVRLVWKEEFSSEKDAKAREAELKGWRREKKLRLIAEYGAAESPKKVVDLSGSGY